MYRQSDGTSAQLQSCLICQTLCRRIGGPTSFIEFKDEAAHPYGGSTLKASPGPPYTSGTEEMREVELNASGGTTPGSHPHPSRQSPLKVTAHASKAKASLSSYSKN